LAAVLTLCPCADAAWDGAGWCQASFVFFLSNAVKVTSHEDGESSSFVKSQKNFSSNNIVTCNNNSSLARRKEVTEEEAER